MACFISTDPAPDDVVISGIAGIFPLSENMDEFEANLFNNINMVEDVDDPNRFREKLGVPCLQGSIADKDKFDSTFFGISHAQTLRMDPTMWRILEKTYEAVVDSGNNISELRNSNTAIIIGTFISEAESLWLDRGQSEGGFSVMGHNRSMLANRVSYWLNTKGPSYAFYSEEVSGVCCLTQAYELIRTHQCDSAIVGTVNLIHRPEVMYAYGSLASQRIDGQCSEFYTRRNEYIKSNACVAMYIQRASDAKRIYAKVTHADYSYYGDRNTGLVRPMSEPMLELLQRFYEKCRIDPEEINYLEINSPGIKVFEEAELEAVDKVILSNRRDPLLLGCVKSNMGNPVSSASLCSIAKVLIAMERGVIPSNLEYKPSVPHIPALTEGKIKVVCENTKWDPKYVAVNAMDICGSYGHVLLQPNNKLKSPENNCTDGVPRLICMSGRDKEKMKNVLDKINNMTPDTEFSRLLQDIHSENIRNHNYRGYVITSSEVEVKEIDHFDGSKRPVWFIFSGMGSQWPGMASHLMKLPVIAETLQECHRILQPKGLDLIHILTTDDPHIFDNVLHSFVGIAAVQLALVKTLKLLDIEPDGIIGHSVGELGCAYADGCFTMEQMILAAYYRGVASLEAELIDGRMAAVGLGYTKVIKILPPTVDVACHNSEDSSTISGPSEDVAQLVGKFKTQGIFVREVNVSNIAYHSRYIRPAAPKLITYLKQVITDPKPRSSRWYSTSAPEELWDTYDARYSSAEYHTNNLLNPVLFEETAKHIPKNAILIEIAPHGLLQAILKRSMGADCVTIPLTQRGNEHGLEFLLAAIGKFYLAGRVPLVSALYPPVQFPVSRGTPSISSLATWDHSKIWRTPENMCTNEKTTMNHYVSIRLNEGKYRLLKGYTVNGAVILPISAIMIMVWQLIGDSRTRNFKKTPVILEKICVENILIFPENESIDLNISYRHVSGNFEISEKAKDKIYFKGQMKRATDIDQEFLRESVSEAEEFEELTADEIYKELEIKGFEPGQQFRKLRKLILNDKGSKALVDCSCDDWIVSMESVMQIAIFHLNEGKPNLCFPSFIEKVVINPFLPFPQDECVAVFNKSTHSVRCRGIEASGIKTKELYMDRTNNVVSRIIRFVPYLKTQYQNSNEFVDAAVQLFLENTISFGLNSLTMTELVNGATLNLASQVKNAVKTCRKDKVLLNAVNVDDLQNMDEVVFGMVLLAGDSSMKIALNLLGNRGGFLLVRLLHSTKLDLDMNFAVLAEQRFGNIKWIILKTRVPVNEESTVICLPHIQIFKFPDNLPENGTTKYYLIAEAKSFDGVEAFITQITEERKYNIKSCRFVFLMDNDMPPFSLSNQFFSDQLSLDLVINVYCNGTWGNLRHFEAPAGTSAVHKDLKRLKTALRLIDFEWSSVGINLTNICPGDQAANNSSVVELSGSTADGHKVMCLARLEPECVLMTTEPHFMWSIPDSWSLEDAATVPLAYSLVYYSLVIRTHKSRKNILIQPGQSCVGQAYIAVALHLGLEVHVAVSSNKHRQFLRNKFPQLQENFIHDLRDRNYEMKLMHVRNYVGFDVVVNFLAEPYLQMSAKLLKFAGFLLQLCRTEMEQRNTFGMSPFLINTSITAIIPESLFEIKEAWKIELHELVTQGIKTGVVQPFDKKLFSFSQKNEMFRTLHDSDFTGNVVVTRNQCYRNRIKNDILLQKGDDTENVFFIGPKKSCLIVGENPEDCVVLAEWLINRGCHNLTLCCGEYAKSNPTRRHLRQLRIHRHAHIAVIPLEKTCVLGDAITLLDDIKSTAPLCAMFVLPMKDLQLLNYLEIVLGDTESIQYFVLLMIRNAHNIVNARRKRGLSVLDVQWDGVQETAGLQHILGHLDNLLVKTPNETVYFSVTETYTANPLPLSGEQLLQFLPSSIKDLEELGDSLMSCTICSLEEVCTKSPRMAYVREVHPVFIVPGLQGPAKSIAESLARNLMCPAIVVHIPGGTDNLQENVAAVVEKMINLQQGGKYNIVGISWGGVYAIELAKKLEAQGEKTHVFLIDGAPHATQAIVAHLGEGSQLQVSLLSTLLHLNSIKVHEDIMHLPDWKSRLHRVLTELQDVPPPSKHRLCVAFESVYSRINTLLNYSSDGILLNGEVTPILPIDSKNDDCELYKFFKEELNVSLVDSNHRTIVESTETAFIVSERVSVDLYWKKE